MVVFKHYIDMYGKLIKMQVRDWFYKRSGKLNPASKISIQHSKGENIMRIIPFFLGVSALMASPVLAHDDISDKARQLGLAVGKTYTCIPEEDRPLARADFEEMFDMIYHVDGNEIAFVFAVAIGYGAASEISETDCTDLLQHVNAVKAELGIGGENQ